MKRRPRLLAVLCLAALAGATPAGADPQIERRIERLRELRGARDSAGSMPAQPAASAGCRRRRVFDREGAERAVRDAWLRYAVPRALIRSVIRHESAWNPQAVSSAGAMGLMQLMPATARELGVPCPFAPRQNVLGGTRYLREMRDRFGSWSRALAAYHAGPTRVVEGRIPSVTRRYVARVLGTWRDGRAGYRNGVASIR